MNPVRLQDILEQAGAAQALYDEEYDLAPQIQFEKGEQLLRFDEVCDYIYFVEEGALRLFYLNAKGQEVTHWFAMEDTVITSGESFFDRKPSRYVIEALEPGSARVMTLERMNFLCDTSHQFERFARLLTQAMFQELNRKVEEMHFKSAKERYDSLITTYPQIFQRAKLGHIASYIGITQQSLSRIRSQK